MIESIVKALAVIAIFLGAFIALFNWAFLLISWRTGRHISPAPLLGAILLGLGLLAFPETRPFAWVAILVDYGTLALILAIPTLLGELRSTSSINLVHRFVSDSRGHHDDIRLFKNGGFTIERQHDPPVECNEHGALSVSQSFVGSWREEGAGFLLDGYDGDRALWILNQGGVYRTREENYPPDRKYPVDRLDSLSLQKMK